LVAEVTNFQKLVLHRSRQRKVHRYGSKGHAEEMTAWAAFLNGDRDLPLPYQQARRSMLLTFAVLDSIRTAQSVTLDASPS
jgi:hypothetical protein